MKGVAVLVGAGLVVVAGVLGLARMVLPTPDPDNPPVAAETSGSTVPATIPTGPPTSVGGVLEFAGDHPGTFVVEGGNFESPQGLRSQTRFQIWSGNDRLILDIDPDEGLFIDQGVFDGANLFPDPGDCTFTLVEDNESTGVARFDVSCPEMTNVQETATLPAQGTLDLPRRLAYTDGRFRSGGELTVDGDLSTELVFTTAEWGFIPQEFVEDDGSSLGFQFYEGGDGQSTSYHEIRFFRDEDDNVHVAWIAADDYYFEAATSCELAVDPGPLVGPHTELLSFHVDCPTLTDDTGEVTVSVTGTLKVARTDVMAGLELEPHP